MRNRPIHENVAQAEAWSQDARVEGGAIPRATRAQRANSILQSLGWLGAAAFIIYYSSMWRVITTDSRVNSFFLQVGFVSMAAQALIFLYATVFLPFRVGRVDDYMVSCPRAVYASIANGLLIWIAFVIALWPIWGFFTPVMLTIIGFAAILSPNLVPSFGKAKK